jgi:cell division protein FtsW
MTPPLFNPAGVRGSGGVDAVVTASCAALLALGLLMIYSARIVADDGGANFFIRQSIFVALGLAASLAALKIPLMWWRKSALWLAAAALVLLLLVEISPLAVADRRGVARWLDFGALTFQPAEFAKLALAVYAAAYSVKQAEKMRGMRGVLPLALVVGAVCFLLLRQPDFGSAVVILALVIAVLFLAGLRLRYFFCVMLAFGAACFALIVASPYRLRRVTSFMDPFADPFSSGYHQSHALMAFGGGGVSGAGLGRSVEKWSHLPEAHTDFIAAVIAEELGFVGFAALILLYVALVTKAFQIARAAAYRGEYFGALAAQGVAALIALHVVFNVGGNLSLLPAKGITLPLISYGGSSLLMTMLMLALLLRVDLENRAGRVLP